MYSKMFSDIFILSKAACTDSLHSLLILLVYVQISDGQSLGLVSVKRLHYIVLQEYKFIDTSDVH